MHFKLRQLQHLVLLADELHFARAAERAALSQSALSRSIQMLETGLGVRLLDRDLKHVELTPLGERLVTRARSLLADTRDIARELALLQSGELGHVAMGAGALAGAVMLPGPLARLRQIHPGVQIDVEVVESTALLDKLLRAGLDFFVGEFSSIPDQPALQIEPLGQMQFGFFCRANHPLTIREVVTLEEMAPYRMASVHIPDSIQRSLNAEMVGGMAALPELSLQSGSLSILRDYVLESDTILLGAAQSLRVELELGVLMPLKVQEFFGREAGVIASTVLGLVFLKKRTPTPAGQLLMDMIRKEAQTLLRPVTEGRPSRRKFRRNN